MTTEKRLIIIVINIIFAIFACFLRLTISIYLICRYYVPVGPLMASFSWECSIGVEHIEK